MIEPAAPADARPADDQQQEDTKAVTRVEGFPSDRPLGSTASRIEVRRDPPSARHPGEIDEIVGSGTFHLERMNESQFALLLYGAAGESMCVMVEPRIVPKRGAWKHVKARIDWHDEPRSADAVDPVAPERAGTSTRDKSSSSSAEARLARLVEGLAQLGQLWLRQQASYPTTDGIHAAAAVRCCVKELADEVRALIAAAQTETPR